jgi:hypothetical protein
MSRARAKDAVQARCPDDQVRNVESSKAFRVDIEILKARCQAKRQLKGAELSGESSSAAAARFLSSCHYASNRFRRLGSSLLPGARMPADEVDWAGYTVQYMWLTCTVLYRLPSLV